jgi:hypothetical protein
MTDTISRQAVIDAIAGERLTDDTGHDGDICYNAALDDALAAINAIPSQPTQSDALRAENERLRAALEAIKVEDGRVTQLQMAHLKQTLKEQSEIREAAKWSS